MRYVLLLQKDKPWFPMGSLVNLADGDLNYSHSGTSRIAQGAFSRMVIPI